MEVLEQLLEKQQALLEASRGASFSDCKVLRVTVSLLLKSQCRLKEWTQEIFFMSPLLPPIYGVDDQKQLNSSPALLAQGMTCCSKSLPVLGKDDFPLVCRNIKTFCRKMSGRGRGEIWLDFNCLNYSPNTVLLTRFQSTLFLKLHYDVHLYGTLQRSGIHSPS